MLTRTIDKSVASALAAGAPASASPQHLAALDGLRFVAAFCVLVAHGYGYVVQQGSTTPPGALLLMVGSLAVPGMTLFFVLSGFVIHLNYSRTATKSWTGTFDFFIARFSRLYPLFLAVFAFDFWRMLSVQGYFAGRPAFNFDLFGPLPVFLSFTQTWLPIPVDGHAIFAHYTRVTGAAQATGAMWSLSLEFLFYATYPWVGAWLSRLQGPRLALCAAVTVLAGLSYFLWVAHHRSAVLDSGMKLFGPENFASFGTWLGFYSPFVRMTEFLLGALAAQQYLSSPKAGDLSAHWPAITTTTVAAAFVALYVALTVAVSPFNGIGEVCAASLVALLILLVARHSTWISRSLSGSMMVKLGEASYSLYLLHWYVMTQWAGHYANPLSYWGRVAVYLVGIAAMLAISRFSFVFFERPSMRWLRRNFKPLRLHLVLGVAFVVITAFSVVASMQVNSVRRFCGSGEAVDCSTIGIERIPAGTR